MSNEGLRPRGTAGTAAEGAAAGAAEATGAAAATAAAEAAGAAGALAPRRVDKPWGHELIWVLTDRYCGKVIVIETGRRLSLQYHEQKDEAILVTAGRLLLHLEDDAGEMTTRELGAGEAAHVAVGRRHRYEAIERVELIEVSTPELADVVRVEDDFGREGTSNP